MPVRRRSTRLDSLIVPGTFGHMLNMFGEPIDEGSALEDVTSRAIQPPKVPLSKRRTGGEVSRTGIKAIDLLAPWSKLARPRRSATPCSRPSDERDAWPVNQHFDSFVWRWTSVLR